MWNKAYSKIYQNVTKEVVWDLLVDVNNWPKWHTNLEYCEMEGEFIAGNNFLLKPKKAPIAKVDILEAKAYTHFTDCTKFLGAKMYNTYALEEIKGSLRLNPSWNTKKTKPLAHAGYKVPGYVLGVPQI